MRPRSGFTLLELSIVLVLIALVVGGVLGGTDLIRSAELRSIEKDMTKFRASYLYFRDKYQAIPGDFTGATAIWGAANATPSTCLTVLGTGIAGTCNGNGDGIITNKFAASLNSDLTPEAFLAWQHLSLAGLTDQQLTGQNTGNFSIIGANMPKMGRDSITAVFKYQLLYNTRANALRLTRTDNVTTTWDDWSIITIPDAQAMDQKLDDGYANSGAIYGGGTGYNGGSATCTGATWDQAGLDYKTNDSTDACTLTWWME